MAISGFEHRCECLRIWGGYTVIFCAQEMDSIQGRGDESCLGYADRFPVGSCDVGLKVE